MSHTFKTASISEENDFSSRTELSWASLKRGLDVLALFGLGGVALLLRGLKLLGLHPLSAAVATRLPIGRQRLVLFIPSLGLGGAQRQIVTFLKHIDRTVWEPELITLDMPDKHFEPAVRELGVSITYLNTSKDFRVTGVTWQLMRYLYAKPCHVLHSWLHYAVALGAIAGNMVGISTIIGSLRSQRPSLFPWAYPKWQRGIHLLTVPLHSYFIANSNAVNEDNRRWALIPETKIHTVYNGIDTDENSLPARTQVQRIRSMLNLPMESPLVGIIGRLEPEKDHATFLRAALQIARAKPDAHFLIVGNGRLREWILSECRRFGLSDKVLVRGTVQDVLSLMQSLDVLVLTSTSEGCPNVLLEAAVAGTPVVTTAAGGVAEIVLNEQTGFVVPCGDADAVAQNVLKLLNDSALRMRVAGASRDRVRTCFAADRTTQSIQTIYERG